jgi:hypothetical protein
MFSAIYSISSIKKNSCQKDGDTLEEIAENARCSSIRFCKILIEFSSFEHIIFSKLLFENQKGK